MNVCLTPLFCCLAQHPLHVFFNIIYHMTDVFLKLSLHSVYASTFILLIKYLLNITYIINSNTGGFIMSAPPT